MKHKHKYRAEYYGVPQRRHRIIIVGIDQKIWYEIYAPAPLNDEEGVVTAGMAIGGRKIPKNSPNNEAFTMSKIVKERLERIKLLGECLE